MNVALSLMAAAFTFVMAIPTVGPLILSQL